MSIGQAENSMQLQSLRDSVAQRNGESATPHERDKSLRIEDLQLAGESLFPKRNHNDAENRAGR